ncbi:MAG TPA: cation-transporting P-type ATPase [Candidatus Limnocylindria bacterium]|nr:cation-transporting P-type ATPase [Candidatus Limnocylindria bacterium]
MSTESPARDTAWYTLSVADALAAQGVDEATGLSTAEVEKRRAQYGPNRFAEAKKESGWSKFVRQYRDPMQIVLLAAALISLIVIRDRGTALLLLGLTLLNAVMSLNQEGKAEASVAALQKMMIVQSRVRRNGVLEQIPAEQLVPGDIVAVEAGDRIPADGRIIKAATLEVDESALTGESAPVPKEVNPVSSPETPLGDRVDMVYMNTSATRGSGELVVTGTGMETEVGHISGMLQTTEDEKTPLTKQLDALTNQIILIAGLALVASIALGRFIYDQPFDVLFISAVAFAVAAVPTGLPAVVTTLLSIGTKTLASAGAIVKRLRSVETLGSTSAINSDKTGTLTLNQMTAVELTIPGRRFTINGEGYSTTGQITTVDGTPPGDLSAYLLPMALCADAEVRDGALVGDPTEGALVVLAAKGGIDPQQTREAIPRVAVLPFDAAYKFMATFHRVKDESGRDVIRAFVKGAPDQLLARAQDALAADGRLVPAAGEMTERFNAENERLAKNGLRVMCVARRDFDAASFDPNADLLPLVTNLTLLGLAGIVDPPRPEARTAIAEAHDAGIQVRMITGDHAVTAGAIAKDLGIRGEAITGAEWGGYSDEEALRRIDDIGVIARVTPEHKVRLVDILKRKGNIVAMTGDGVNDAPALKKADIGVAMGITGTEVSKEAAVMILTDDNFATIVKAVEKGRALYDNLVKYIRYQMGVLFGMIWTFLGSGLFNVLAGVPFVPQQTLYVNFTTQVLQSIGLGLGEPTEGLMERPPRRSDEQVMPLPLGIRLAIYGAIQAASALIVIQWISINTGDDDLARTMGLVTFSFANLFYGLACNDLKASVFSHALLANAKLLQMSLISLGFIILGAQLDLLNRLLKTVPLNIDQWVLCALAGSVILWVMEVVKLFSRRSGPEPEPAAVVVAAAEM